MRGQAFIVFDSIAAASTALRSLQGFPLHNSPIKISYAKSKSNIVKYSDGSFGAAKTVLSSAPSGEGTKRYLDDDDQQEEAAATKKQKESHDMDQDEFNQILFVSNLPSSVTEDALRTLFQQHQGFKEVRTVPGKADIAFVEFESGVLADKARAVLNGFNITPSKKMDVAFAKK